MPLKRQHFGSVELQDPTSDHFRKNADQLSVDLASDAEACRQSVGTSGGSYWNSDSCHSRAFPLPDGCRSDDASRSLSRKVLLLFESAPHSLRRAFQLVRTKHPQTSHSCTLRRLSLRLPSLSHGANKLVAHHGVGFRRPFRWWKLREEEDAAFPARIV